MLFIASVVLVFVILCLAELWWRKRKPEGEFSRKLVHMTVGSFVAFWPFFLNWTEIRLLSVAFIIVVVVSKRLKVFRAIHSVQRPTWGEIFFAIIVGLATFVTHDKWIYAISLLQMSLADGLAAVIGVNYGRRQRYHVFGHPKSVIGSLTFFIVSVALLELYSVQAHHLSVAYIAGLSIVATFIENIAVAGLDNLLVPLLIAAVLEHMR
jgi:phytol kinase